MSLTLEEFRREVGELLALQHGFMIRHEAELKAYKDLLREIIKGEITKEKEIGLRHAFLFAEHHQKLLDRVEDVSPEYAALLDKRKQVFPEFFD